MGRSGHGLRLAPCKVLIQTRWLVSLTPIWQPMPASKCLLAASILSRRTPLPSDCICASVPASCLNHVRKLITLQLSGEFTLPEQPLRGWSPQADPQEPRRRMLFGTYHRNPPSPARSPRSQLAVEDTLLPLAVHQLVIAHLVPMADGQDPRSPQSPPLYPPSAKCMTVERRLRVR